jgi:hypothetical protein
MGALIILQENQNGDSMTELVEIKTGEISITGRATVGGKVYWFNFAAIKNGDSAFSPRSCSTNVVFILDPEGRKTQVEASSGFLISKIMEALTQK